MKKEIEPATPKEGAREPLLTPSEYEAFGKGLLGRLLDLGFGTLTKREMEIFIFHLLGDTEAFRGKKNYELANLLKIPERKIKELRSEAALKYRPASREEALGEIARLFFTYRQNNPCIENGMVVFGMEDPVLKREFESAVKEIGHFIDYSFNREIVKVKAHVFLAVFARNIGSVEASMVEAAKREIKDEKAAAVVLDKTLGISQRTEKFLAGHKNQLLLLRLALAALA